MTSMKQMKRTVIAFVAAAVLAFGFGVRKADAWTYLPATNSYWQTYTANGRTCYYEWTNGPMLRGCGAYLQGYFVYTGVLPQSEGMAVRDAVLYRNVWYVYVTGTKRYVTLGSYLESIKQEIMKNQFTSQLTSTLINSMTLQSIAMSNLIAAQ